MNFKTIGLNIAAATAIVAGTVAIIAPAQALNLKNSFLSLEASGKLVDANAAVGSDSKIDFAAGNVGKVGVFSDGGFTSFIGSNVTLQDVMLTRTSANTWELKPATVNNFFIFANAPISYLLQSFALTRDSSGKFTADFTGIFTDGRDGEVVAGLGEFTSQRRFGTTGTSISMDVTTIPTPALLPGLLALSMGALRKRKPESELSPEQS